MAQFDEYADRYQEHMSNSVGLAGLNPVYFDRLKYAYLNKFVFTSNAVKTVLDFGCGIGNLSSLIAKSRPDLEVTGFDISSKSLDLAKQRSAGIPNLHYSCNLISSSRFDVILAANVFHHIPAEDRIKTISGLKEKMDNNSRLIIFEHNPINPITKYVVSTCAFDKDAKLLTPGEVKNLATTCGLHTIRKFYTTFIPFNNKLLWNFEFKLFWLPIGAQFMIILGIPD